MLKEELWLQIFKVISTNNPKREDFVAMTTDVDIIYEALIKATTNA